jgi:hypothetical protein
MSNDDRRLGMDRDISRRDFVNGRHDERAP